MLSRFWSSVRRNWVIIGAFSWLFTLTVGVCLVFKFDSIPGLTATSGINWPENSNITRSTTNNTLVMLLHPKCPCSRASLQQVATLTTNDNSLQCIFLVYAPTTFPKGWEKTDIWNLAAEVPGAQLVSDIDGAEARKFGAITSGQTYIFDRKGILKYSGGLTEGRGHIGECKNLDLAVKALREGTSTASGAVYGCPIEDPKKAQL
jgi:hypothetical protein